MHEDQLVLENQRPRFGPKIISHYFICYTLNNLPCKTFSYKLNVHKLNMLIVVGKINNNIIPFESVMPSTHLILCCHLLLLPSLVPSIRVFSSELAVCIRWPKYWSFTFSISPSNGYSGLISFRMNQFDLCAVPGTLESLLPHHASVSHTCYLFLYLSFQNCFHYPFL